MRNGDAAPSKNAHIPIRQINSVRRKCACVENTVFVENFGWGFAIACDAFIGFAFCFGKVNLRHEIMLFGKLRNLAPMLGSGCVFGMYADVGTNAPVCGKMPIPNQCTRFNNGSVLFKIIIIAESEHGIAERSANADFGCNSG